MPNKVGLSTNKNCTSQAQCLKKDLDFIARYYSRGPNKKNLTFAEAQALTDAGLSTVAVYENRSNVAEYFSYARGHNDGVDAYYYASQTIHQPAGSAIYFAVDYDASTQSIAGAIKDYFYGVSKGFNDASNNNPVYTIGVYGSGCTCGWLLANTPFIKLCWLAESTGWCGSKTFAGWNIKQSIMPADKTICGFDQDAAEDNVSQGAFGDFMVPV
jgi:hypothetical protein